MSETDWGAADAASRRASGSDPHPKDIGRKPSKVHLQGVEGNLSAKNTVETFDHVEVNDGYAFCNDGGNVTLYPMHRIVKVERLDQ